MLLPSPVALRSIYYWADFSDVIFVLGPALPLLQAAQSRASSCSPNTSTDWTSSPCTHRGLLLSATPTKLLTWIWLAQSLGESLPWPNCGLPEMVLLLSGYGYSSAADPSDENPGKSPSPLSVLVSPWFLWITHATAGLLSASGCLSGMWIWKIDRSSFCCRPMWPCTAKIHGKALSL